MIMRRRTGPALLLPLILLSVAISPTFLATVSAFTYGLTSSTPSLTSTDGIVVLRSPWNHQSWKMVPSSVTLRARKPRVEHTVRSTPRSMVVMGISPRPDAETSAFEIGEKDSDSIANASDNGEENHLVSTPIGLIGHFETQALLAHRGKMGSFVASLDMSKTKQELTSTEEGVALPRGGGVEPVLVATWDELSVVLKKATKGQYGCWELYGDGNSPPQKVSDISESTNRPAMLCAPIRAPGPPTMVLGGFSMHRISGGDQKSAMEPGLDTELKVDASGARRAYGRVLDTCTGLGYTAIAAARCPGVTEVVTVELDEVCLRMCTRNPWSRELFDSPKITSLRGDCCELVKSFSGGEFAAVIHDPPARALCKTTDLYGAVFYAELARVLKPGGTLFHYVGNPASTEGGRLFRGVIERLLGAGFRDCKTDKKVFGVVARR